MSNDTAISGIILSNYSLNFYSHIFEQTFPIECAPNWQGVDTACQSDETYTTWYNDTNSCGTIAGRPSNDTTFCDFDDNGIIGNTSDIETTNLNVGVYIDGAILDLSRDFNSTQTVELREGGTARARLI